MTDLTRRAVLIAPIALAAALAGCTPPPPPRPRFPAITFRHRPPIRLNVREIRVEQAYVPPAKAPNIEHLLAVPPEQAAARWARDRLVAAGTSGRLDYVVRDASMVEVPLTTKGGLTGLVTTEQAERYDARVEIEMKLIEDGGRVAGTATAEAVRSRTVAENITLNQRETVWFQMTEDLMKDLDQQLETTIRSALAPFVLP